MVGTHLRSSGNLNQKILKNIYILFVCKHIQAGNHARHDNFMEKVSAHQPAPEHLWHTICQRSDPSAPAAPFASEMLQPEQTKVPGRV